MDLLLRTRKQMSVCQVEVHSGPFFEEGISKRTVYHILKKGIVDRVTGTGRKSTIMTVRTLRNISHKFNNADSLSQWEAAKKYWCTQSYISKCLQKVNIKCYKKRKLPGYIEDQISSVKYQCRWMARRYATKDLILNDEAYFTLAKHQMPGNNFFYGNNLATSTP